MRGRDFPVALAERFIKFLGPYPVGSFVRLTNGEYGFVRTSNPKKPLLPEILVAFDQDMRRSRSGRRRYASPAKPPSRIRDRASTAFRDTWRNRCTAVSSQSFLSASIPAIIRSSKYSSNTPHSLMMVRKLNGRIMSTSIGRLRMDISSRICNDECAA